MSERQRFLFLSIMRTACFGFGLIGMVYVTIDLLLGLYIFAALELMVVVFMYICMNGFDSMKTGKPEPMFFSLLEIERTEIRKGKRLQTYLSKL